MRAGSAQMNIIVCYYGQLQYVEALFTDTAITVSYCVIVAGFAISFRMYCYVFISSRPLTLSTTLTGDSCWLTSVC